MILMMMIVTVVIKIRSILSCTTEGWNIALNNPFCVSALHVLMYVSSVWKCDDVLHGFNTSLGRCLYRCDSEGVPGGHSERNHTTTCQRAGLPGTDCGGVQEPLVTGQ